jgi:NADH dehydrogenase
VWVEDVATCFLAALDKPATEAHAYQLGGPEVFGFEQLVDILADAEGVKKPKLHLPSLLMRPAVSLLTHLLPNFPITSDQLTMLLEDNICDIAEMRETFGVAPARLEDHLHD